MSEWYMPNRQIRGLHTRNNPKAQRQIFAIESYSDK
jgi:hypothetical protein